MIVCKECQEEFTSRDAGEEHIKATHTDAIDEHLQEYISDAERDTCDDLLEGEDE